MKGVEWHKTLLWGDRLARWGIAMVFGYAAVPKLLDVQGFAKIIEAYGILADFLILPVAIILPVIEVVLAIGLLCNGWTSKVGSMALLLLFIALLSYSIWVGLDIDCGCFGPEDPEYSAFHGLRTALLRDVGMCLPLIYSFWYHRKKRSPFQIHGEKQ
ncbi:MAG: DoxX family protein [Desulforhopalus sp.]|nr:DoxX family protein [Desulforhopalus sp.]